MEPAEADSPLAIERRRQGLSRPQLARKARVGRNTVWRAEVGRAVPHPSTRALLAAALGVDPAILFPDEDSRP